MASKITLDMVAGLTSALSGKAPTGSYATTTGVTAEIAAAVAAVVAALPPVTAWVAYTPTITGFGTVSAVAFRSRRVGGSLEVQGLWTAGTPTGVASAITLGFGGVNGGLQVSTINGTARHIVGNGAISAASTIALNVLAANGDAFVNLGYQSSGFGGLSIRNGSDIVSAGHTLGINFTVPILGW